MDYNVDPHLCTPAGPAIGNCLYRKLIWLNTILLSNYSNGEHIVWWIYV